MFVSSTFLYSITPRSHLSTSYRPVSRRLEAFRDERINILPIVGIGIITGPDTNITTLSLTSDGDILGIARNTPLTFTQLAPSLSRRFHHRRSQVTSALSPLSLPLTPFPALESPIDPSLSAMPMRIEVSTKCAP